MWQLHAKCRVQLTVNGIIQRLALGPCQGHDDDSTLDAIALFVVFHPGVVKAVSNNTHFAQLKGCGCLNR
jgi:hypothetical protein